MSRESSPYVVGDYWLDRRRDGASPDIWQCTTYATGSRQVVYRSTRLSDLERAKGWLHSYVDRQRANQLQAPEQAKIAPALFVYWREHGKKAERPDSIACSLRHFLGFLMQDTAGVAVTFAAADRAMFARFIAWRMAPHSYELEWEDKTYKHTSAGVKGETVHSDLARVSAGLSHQVEYGRVAMAPKVAKVDKRERSEGRDYRFTIEQMGAVMAVASYDVQMFRFLALQLATLVRPEAALGFDPRQQYDATTGLIDLHPKGWPRTKKRNPVVPAIDEFKPILKVWAKDGAEIVSSHKRAWRTIRRVLALPPQAEPKTLRYSAATLLRNTHRVPFDQIEMQLGHRIGKAVTERYAKFDPDYLAESKAGLSKVWSEVMDKAAEWHAVQTLSKSGNGKSVVIDFVSEITEDFRAWIGGAAYRTRTCDPRITNAMKARKTAVSSKVLPERKGK